MFSVKPLVLFAASEMASVRVRRRSVIIFLAWQSAFCFEMAEKLNLGIEIAANIPRKITTRINSTSENAFFCLVMCEAHNNIRKQKTENRRQKTENRQFDF